MVVSVIGLGSSAEGWFNTPCDISIGVNDCAKFGKDPDYLLLANWPMKFPQHRLNIIKDTRPKQFFSSVEQWKAYFPGMIKIRLNSWDGPLYRWRPEEFSSSDTSPFIAVSMAYKLGASNIVLWGVDMVDHHIHNTKNPARVMELRKWHQMIGALDREGVKVWLGKEGSVLNLPVWISSQR